MNVQQINDSGHNIWLFAVVSLVALLITSITWFAIEDINKARARLQEIVAADKIPDGERDYGSLSLRLYLLGWFIRHGSVPNQENPWSSKATASLPILTNSSVQFYRDPTDTAPETACAHVAYLIRFKAKRKS